MGVSLHPTPSPEQRKSVSRAADWLAHCAVMTGPAIVALETERLLLRPMVMADAHALLALDADPEVMRHLNGGRPSTPAEIAAGLPGWVGHRWMAADVAGQFVGWFSIRPSGPAERELGYRLRREHWGRGYATEGSLAVIAAAFDQFGAARVWGQTMTVNHRSRAVMERCGLRYVRTFHAEWNEPIEGTAQGDVEYELLRDEWRAPRRGT